MQLLAEAVIFPFHRALQEGSRGRESVKKVNIDSKKGDIKENVVEL